MKSDLLAVATHDLSVRYGRHIALAQVNLRVPEGAVYVLIGANGAGKSTAMKVLLNLERPESGHVEVFGLDTSSAGPQVRAQIGYVPESHVHPYGWLTCGSLMQHVAAHYPAWDTAYAVRLTTLFALDLGKKIGALSKGDARRLQFVLALGHRPPLLLLDEPTDGFDPLVRNLALTVLAEHLADRPTTVLISTHHVAEVESLADHVGVLRSGVLTAQMSRDELRRTAMRYRLEVPDETTTPAGLRVMNVRRSPAGREQIWTIVGEESEITGRLRSAGVAVRDVQAVSLEEAALAFLSEEVSR